MELGKIHIWTGLVANVCVIAGIVFLAVELSQNSRMMAAQTRTSITSEILYLTQLQSGAEYRTALAKLANEEELNPIDENALVNVIVQSLRHWENVYYQYENGLFEESEFSGIVTFIENLFEDPFTKELWQTQRAYYSNNFRNFVDSVAE